MDFFSLAPKLSNCVSLETMPHVQNLPTISKNPGVYDVSQMPRSSQAPYTNRPIGRAESYEMRFHTSPRNNAWMRASRMRRRYATVCDGVWPRSALKLASTLERDSRRDKTGGDWSLYK